jgi:hypothetical protein
VLSPLFSFAVSLTAILANSERFQSTIVGYLFIGMTDWLGRLERKG